MLFKIVKGQKTLNEFHINDKKIQEELKGNIQELDEITQSKIKELQEESCQQLLDDLKEVFQKLEIELSQSLVDNFTSSLQFNVAINGSYEVVVISQNEEYPLSMISDMVKDEKIITFNNNLYDKETLQPIDYSLELRTTTIIEVELTSKNSELIILDIGDDEKC